MCYLHVFWPITFIIVVVAAQNQEPAPAGPYDKLTNFYFWKCHNKTKSDAAFDKLYADAVEFKNFLQYTFTLLPDNKNIFCESERTKLDKRMTEVSNDLEPCLANGEKYLPEFIRISFKEFLHFLCHNNGEHITTFFSKSSQECRDALESKGTEPVTSCFSKIFKPMSGYLKKTELCEDLSTAKKCFSAALEETCPSYAAYKLLNEDFFKYVGKPCSGCDSYYLNTFMLVATIIFSYMFSH
ncbi:hypothetical protein JTB14_037089 [Gonioctena quinquepunctata]|nr:hypothetical protein JTB14_037089 [Gonioctena quinquepunctata]